ncbi:LamG domain-containing protein [Brunnivagina elsteri]|uniref:LamG-like jellyroll fold domain-containing protein n=1 Tax=Brunnivagina elsteri CCALA 953 TaxID=987040 RepID=A0A2A2TNN2_9CYAN|nr:LamG domain-containing protein [Calothrix elsteri]PAX59964.1 hypothetical protein CK510_04275 [Calothrix elsteri CCALA 953]
MTNANDNLVLHLKLDGINEPPKGNILLRQLQLSIQGNAQVVLDETFGSSSRFDGKKDYLEIPNSDAINFGTDQNFTVETWVKVAAEQACLQHSDNDIIEKWSSSGGYPYVIRYLRNEQTIFAARYDASNNPSVCTKTKLKPEKFYHIAFVKKEKKLFLYLDGQEEGSADDITQRQTQSDSPLYIGRRGGSDSYSNFFTGTIANLRIYNKALSPEEIKRDMDEELSAIASFKKTYPLDFNLYEGEDKESVIFIDNGTQGQELILEMSNNSEQPLTLTALSGNASASNHHFELRFRPETLSPTSLQQIVLKTIEGWSMSLPVTQADDTVSLYFLTSNNQVLGTNNTVSLTLQNVNGAAAGGARTTRVELLCPQFSYQGENVTNYYREKTLSIISHRGKKNIPLHVGFVESNRILNDSKTANELILRIVNVLKDKPISLIPASKGDEASKFIISFDVDYDWGLGRKSQVQGIEIKGKDWQQNKRHIEEWKIVKETQGESTTWTITNQNEENVELRPEQGVQLTISNIISSLPSGQTNLYIRYENIPDFWDGTFICTIEKTPILYKEGNVGIGIADPGNYKLNVEGGDTRLGGSLHLESSAEDYQIELCSYPIDNNPCSYIKIGNTSKEISIGRANANGLEVFIFSSNGTEKSQQVFYQRNLSETEGEKGWNGLANWINNSAADGDLVAMISKLTYAGTHVTPVPSGGFAEEFFKRIGAFKALKIVDDTPYALLFVKGRYGVMECLADTRNQKAQIITSHHHIYPNLEIKGDLKVVNGAITINQTTITENQLQDLIKLLGK